jgi:hypothetical protein
MSGSTGPTGASGCTRGCAGPMGDSNARYYAAVHHIYEDTWINAALFGPAITEILEEDGFILIRSSDRMSAVDFCPHCGKAALRKASEWDPNHSACVKALEYV